MTLPPDAAPERTSSRAGVWAEALSGSEPVRWIVLAFAGFLVGQVVSLFSVTIVANLEGQASHLTTISTEASPPQWYIISSLLGLWVGFIGAPVLASRMAGPVRRHLGVAFKPIDLIGVPIGIAAQYVIAALYSPFLRHLHNFDAPVTKITGSSHGSGLWLIAVFTIVGAPFAEELFFRGLLLRGLVGVADRFGEGGARKAATAIAVVLDGLLFGLAHGELEQLAGLALFGIVLSILFMRTGRLAMGMLAHAGFNSVTIITIAGGSGVVLHHW